MADLEKVPEGTVDIKSWQDVETMLAEIKTMEKAVDEQKARIIVYAMHHPEDFDGKRKQLLEGAITQTDRSRTWLDNNDENCEALRAHGYGECVNVTYKPVLAALSKLDPEVQAAYGIHTEIVTTYNVQPNVKGRK